MAELLVRLKNNTHSDPIKDRMCYKRGDVVLVMPNGHPWGISEGLPDFAIIKTDRTVAQMEKFCLVHEVSKIETHKVPLEEWKREKAKGGKSLFSKQPKEGLIETLNIPLNPLLGDRLRTGKKTFINLSGPVLHPHTRRKWKLNEAIVTKAELTGFAKITFTELRNELQDKITGVKA